MESEDAWTAAAFFFATAAFTNFFATAALVWLADPSWANRGCTALPGRTGSPEVAAAGLALSP